ncbi:MAG: two-component system sensor histidine kinase NtrB [Bacteroidota bacterium]
MKILNISKRTFIIISTIAMLIAIAVFGTMKLLEQWTNEIVETNTELTRTTVKKITAASLKLIDSLDRTGFFSVETLTKREWRKIDSLFSMITADQSRSINGMEGGFYFTTIDEMIGYSWPTAPEPAPAYGPAPRSYPIIKGQILKSIKMRQSLIEFHSFDFAVFPLASEPLVIRNKVVGGTWSRIHVERELPSSKLLKVLNFSAIVAIGALGAALILLWIRRRHVNAIRAGLDQVRLDPSYRLPLESGVYGAIASSINSMVDAMMKEQRKREQLERDIHQQDKMATLGKLIAGVAHEVKTPLAVIKTRIQMWQRDLRQVSNDEDNERMISDESMELVVKEINRLSNLVKRLLVFAKPTQNIFQRHSINDVIRQTAQIIQLEAESKSISIVLRCSDSIPMMQFDHHAMEQVCLNISMNAVESMQQNGILTIATNLSGDGSSAVIFISDTGKGIPEELRHKIFDPFFTTKEHGVGLGLSISYEIVKAHGGKIEFIPVDGPGAACSITLPILTEHRK